MRGGRGVGLVLWLALGACRSRAPGTPEDAGTPPPPVATYVGPHCDTLLPGDVRDLALPGATLSEERACANCGPLCTLRSAAEPDATVSFAYNCQPMDASADLREQLTPTLRAGGVEVPALGRAAARRSPVPGMLQVVAWDDDTPCVLVVTWLGRGNERAVDVMRTALLAVTTASLVPPPTEEAGMPSPFPEDAGTAPALPDDAGTP
ncbi:hypothetical protein [Hyalangium rubrum]|uniref:Lipoprotein n=1 Tax=Hyalangium rubrum TaxID=3103134 RepID=A0ABU5HG74_9BACT|nr:hypothetical protein [Hyalangium sp. s54d21]MDY7231854.1 hypothetical protein [Hyalangium sp. s54d21]